MIRTLRWLAFVPAALLASVLAGAIGSWFAEFSGARSWYVWVVSGAASAWAFFYVASRVAPAPSVGVKWVSAGLVGILGAMAALGPLMKGQYESRALAGLVMVILAIHHARQRAGTVVADDAATSRE